MTEHARFSDFPLDFFNKNVTFGRYTEAGQNRGSEVVALKFNRD